MTGRIGSTPAAEGFQDALLEDDPVQLYERAPCGYLSTTPEGRIVKANETFLTWTGYDRAALVGAKTFAELLTPGGRIYHETHYAPMLRMQGSARELALDLVKADGGRLPVLVNAVLESDDEGRAKVVRLALFDATERREYERELLRQKDRAERSEARARSLATTLQQTLIPPTPPEVPGLEVAGVYRPAGDGEEVGGDFYDVFQIAEDDWVVVLGDVCGKGVEAAVVAALVRYTVRAVTVQEPGAATALRLLNDLLLRQQVDRFSTLVLLRVRRREGQWMVTLSSAGHPLPWLFSGHTDPVQVGEPGSLVGVFESARWADTALALAPGDALMLYTDGVTEGRGATGFYGDDRLRDLVRGLDGPASAIAGRVVADVLDFQGDLAKDDIAVVVVRVPG
jgi:phosphoserine phosphatase RsbU/P